MKDFNIANYLRENHLGSHAILGAYVDLHSLKEEEETKLDTEIPYEGPEHKLDGFGDEFEQDSPVEEVDSMDTDDSVNPFPSLMPDEQDKFDRMMGLIDQSIQPRLGQVKSVIDGAREQGYADRTIFTVLARHPLVMDSIEALVDDGFEFQDIVDFFATDFSQNEEIAGYDAGVKMKEADSITADPGLQYDDEDGDYDDEDDRFASLGGEQIQHAIKNLIHNKIDGRQIVQFVIDTVDRYESF
jgi:hypothetical protein